jgi:hypothetical protein
MSKLMWIAGILFLAAGIALGLMVFVSTASVISWGITLEVAVLLIVGGVLSLGLGGLINNLEVLASRPAPTPFVVQAESAPAAPIPEFGRRSVFETVPPRAAAAAAAAPVVEAAEMEVSEPVKETIEALEEARQKIEKAFEPKPVEVAADESAEPDAAEAPAAPVLEPIVEVEELEVEIAEAEAGEPGPEAEPEEEGPPEGQLYVVEERIIRSRPARVLSDGTVEAETDEGWMRFENLEHLDEYLDAMSPAAQA